MVTPITKSPTKTLSAIEEMQSRIFAMADLAKQREQEEPPTQACKVVQLPLWPEAVRGIPNGMLRSALFGAIKRGKRRYMERQEIHAQEGISIIYTGARLDQGDLDVWETVLHVVRLQALGDECRVTAYQILKLMGLTDTGINRDTLDRRLSRMKATGVDVKVGRYGYEGSLIDEVFRDKATRQYVIRLNHMLIGLFAADQFTQIDWNIRCALNGKPLAQWLHGFYASHAQPFPMRMETLLKLSGSENSNPRSAQQTLRKALNAVREASAAYGEGFSHEIRGDLVYVEKQAKGAQRRHLAKKVAKR